MGFFTAIGVGGVVIAVIILLVILAIVGLIITLLMRAWYKVA